MPTVFDLLTIDLKTLPDHKSVESRSETNKDGVKVTEYTRALDKIECGLFKMARVIVLEGRGRNAGLSNPNLSSVKVATLEQLVNQLFSFYGKDQSGRGAFDAEDDLSVHNSIEDPTNAFWVGRMWNLGKHAVMLTLDDEGLEMFIHGVE